MPAVPAVHAHARALAALAVHRAPRVASLHIAHPPHPALLAHAPAGSAARPVHAGLGTACCWEGK